MPRENEDEMDEDDEEDESAASNASMLVDFTEVMKMGVFVQARSSFFAVVSPSPSVEPLPFCLVLFCARDSSSHERVYPRFAASHDVCGIDPRPPGQARLGCRP